jgi:ribonucleoside-diphosphate reductase alpha chain
MAYESKTYNYNDVLSKTIEYFKGNQEAAKLWVSKYALKNSLGDIYDKSPADMHRRISRELSRIEQKYPDPISEKEIFKLLDHFKYLIPSPRLMNEIGHRFRSYPLAETIVIGCEGHSDSYGAIIKMDEEVVQLSKCRLNVGVNVSHIRPKGFSIKGSSLSASGIVPFAERYMNSVKEVRQVSQVESLTLTISILHPDFDDLLKTDANLVILVNDYFMNNMANNQPFIQKYPVDSAVPKISTTKNPLEVWKSIFNRQSKGFTKIAFSDSILKDSLHDHYSHIGYQSRALSASAVPYATYDGNRSMALNLYAYVRKKDGKVEFDTELFKSHIAMAVRLMDDVVDLEIEKIDAILEKIETDPEDEEIKQTERRMWEKVRMRCEDGRRAGLGLIGIIELLEELSISQIPEMLAIEAERIYKLFAIEVYRNSVLLAKQRGCFKTCDYENVKNVSFIKYISEAEPLLLEDWRKFGRRNISSLVTVSGEDIRLLAQLETKMIHEPKTAYDWRKFFRLLGKVQRWWDTPICIPMTIDDLPSPDIFKDICIEAWRLGTYSLAILREEKKEIEQERDMNTTFVYDANVVERPAVLDCDVVRFQNNKERWIAFIGLLGGRPYEIFTGLADEEEGIMLPKTITFGKIIKSKDADGRSRYDFQFSNKRGYKTTIEGLSYKFNPEYWNYAKLISGVLRYGMPIEQVIKLVSGLQLDNESINTWKVGVERALKRYTSEGSDIEGQVCPNCGEFSLSHQEGGRIVCSSCGYNRQ